MTIRTTVKHRLEDAISTAYHSHHALFFNCLDRAHAVGYTIPDEMRAERIGFDRMLECIRDERRSVLDQYCLLSNYLNAVTRISRRRAAEYLAQFQETVSEAASQMLFWRDAIEGNYPPRVRQYWQTVEQNELCKANVAEEAAKRNYEQFSSELPHLLAEDNGQRKASEWQRILGPAMKMFSAAEVSDKHRERVEWAKGKQ